MFSLNEHDSHRQNIRKIFLYHIQCLTGFTQFRFATNQKLSQASDPLAVVNLTGYQYLL